MKKVSALEIMKKLKKLVKKSLIDHWCEFDSLKRFVKIMRKFDFFKLDVDKDKMKAFGIWRNVCQSDCCSFEELMLWWPWVAGSRYGYFLGDCFDHMYGWDNKLFLRLCDEFDIGEEVFFRPKDMSIDVLIKIYKDFAVINGIKIKTQGDFVDEAILLLDSLFCDCNKTEGGYTLKFKNGVVVDVKFDDKGSLRCSRHGDSLCEDIGICCLKDPTLLATLVCCNPEKYAKIFKYIDIESLGGKL